MTAERAVIQEDIGRLLAQNHGETRQRRPVRSVRSASK
jgi:hypothetical protein